VFGSGFCKNLQICREQLTVSAHCNVGSTYYSPMLLSLISFIDVAQLRGLKDRPLFAIKSFLKYSNLTVKKTRENEPKKSKLEN
jgi:hypothetical protein